jgi:hypothetical protein
MAKGDGICQALSYSTPSIFRPCLVRPVPSITQIRLLDINPCSSFLSERVATSGVTAWPVKSRQGVS